MDGQRLLPNVLSQRAEETRPINTNKCTMYNASDASITTSSSTPPESQLYKVYKRRWYMLATLAVLNFSNAIGWITFAPVADLTANYYKLTDFSKVNWLSLIYMIATIPIGFLSTWVLDTFGLRVGMMMGAWLNVIGLGVRYASTIDSLDDYKFTVVMVGQGIAAVAQPFLLFAPTKLAAVWFPDSQRAIANTLGSASNPLGILAAFLFSGIIVKEPADIPTMLWIFIIPGGVAAAMMTLGFCNSVPPTPPSASAAELSESFLEGVKKIIRNRAYMLLLLVFGAGLGLFNAISSLVEQIMCSKGYDNMSSSVVGALMIGGGMVGAIVTGVYVDKTKRFESTAKLCFTVAVLGAIAFCTLSCYRDAYLSIAAAAFVFGTCGFGAYPVIMELGVETTFPVAEGTSTGFLVMAGQVEGIIAILIGQYLSQDLTPAQKLRASCTGSVESQDLTIPLMIYAGYAAVTACVFLLFFRTEYRRLKAEERHGADSILNFSSQSRGTPVTGRSSCQASTDDSR